MQQASITFKVRATGPDLHLSVLLDDTEIHALEPSTEDQTISIKIDDDVESDHCLSFVMSGKMMDHTQINEQGQIVQDRVIVISEVRMDDIELGYVFTQSARYTHDRNGSAAETIETFYGDMGCNGQVNFCFRTPVYLWLLETM